ncbi:hypothetical protein Emag_003819 [Eimeria magna]
MLPATSVRTASMSAIAPDVCWSAEPLGYVKTPEPLTRLIWERPLLLFGVACDAALLVVTGLEKLGSQTRVQSNEDSKSTNREGENHERVAFKVSAVALRTVVPNGDHASEEADLSRGESETEEASDLEPVVGVSPGTLKDKETASRRSLAEPAVTGNEMRQALAAAMEQQRRRRAAAAALAAASARVTAITTGVLKASADSSRFTWRIPQNESTGSFPGDLPGDAVQSATTSLIFSGTGALRNALWCAPLKALLEKTTEEPSACIRGDQVGVRPLISLCKVFQRGRFKPYEREIRFAGPFLTQIVVVSSDGLLVAGTCDGRVLLLLADAPDSCAVHATRSGPAQQHADKQQQQQQLLRRLLMADSPVEDEHWSRPDESAGAKLHNAKKQKDLKALCPEPVDVDEFLRVVAMHRGPAESCLRSNDFDQTDDVHNPSEPTLVERHQLQQKQEVETKALDAINEERRKLQQIRHRYKARKSMSLAKNSNAMSDLVAEVRCLAGAITEELQAKLMLHTSLSEANEAEAANSMEELDCQLQSAKRHHQAIISNITDSATLEAVAEDTVDPKAQADLLAVVQAARVQELKELLMQEPPEIPSVPSREAHQDLYSPFFAEQSQAFESFGLLVC